ncbi:glycosyltransferase [Prochlorococcus sp. MIT 1341]|uniref:glycosyltransferase n=1 Tax=Prochlorococcus sp. MIT 1341 TaxID=3096221 RepID=UPI002A75FA41|nr:glycosyltransferase [Prochlorococcus sp. MIT 1341]
MKKKFSRSTNILLVTKDLSDCFIGGRERLSQTYRSLLHKLFPESLLIFCPYPYSVNAFARYIYSIVGMLDGLTPSRIFSIITLVKKNNIELVFIDGSNYGLIALVLRLYCPNVHITSLFHNVESRFFWGSFLRKKTLKALGIILSNYIAEFFCIWCSHTSITLTSHDQKKLKFLYQKESSEVVPLVIDDSRSVEEVNKEIIPIEPYLLFVGGPFYANIQGVEWYIKNVSEKAPLSLYIVGNGFELYSGLFANHKNVKFVGSVRSLSPWYNSASAVIAPIFDGSGMKTKVAEALQYGKAIIGTKEAFTGYTLPDHKGIFECISGSDFIQAINTIHDYPPPRFDISLRSIYEAYYSYEAGYKKLYSVLNLE